MKSIFRSLWLVIPMVGITNLLAAQWVRVLGGEDTTVTCLGQNGTNLFAGLYGIGVSRSTNNGTTWTPANTGLQDDFVQTFATNGTYVFAGTGTYNGGVFRSTDNGTSWTRVDSGLGRWPVNALLVNDTNLFAGTGDYFYGGSAFLSTNNGSKWTPVLSVPNTSISALVSNGTNVFAGTDLGGVFRSSNNGTTWTPANLGLTDTNITSLAVSGTNIFAGTLSGGIFLSTNNGSTWTPVNAGLPPGTIVHSLCVSGTNLFRGCGGGSTSNGVYLSTNNGGTWTAANSGLPNRAIKSLFASGMYLFAVAWDDGLWRREIITSVQEIPGEMPRNFALQQNYPNPFNPSTTIEFSVPVASFVSLKVYDMLGREVSTIVNEALTAGVYRGTFYGTGLPSGVYFYRLRAGDFVESKKLVLQK